MKGSFNYDKVLKLASDNSDGVADIKVTTLYAPLVIHELTVSPLFDNHSQGAIAAIHFMLTNAAKFDVDEKSLILEIQQLGLPKENSEAIAKQYRDTKDMLRSKFAEDSYRVSKLVSTDWRVDQIVATSQPAAGGEGGDNRIVQTGPLVHVNVNIDTKPEISELEDVFGRATGRFKDIAFEISPQKLDVLIHELTHVHSLLQNMDS